jgi:hypothetical protein
MPITDDLTAESSQQPDAHVVFEFEVEDGWPPVAAERVWAFRLGGDRYRIDNVPWFVRDLAVGDVVRAVSPDADTQPVFVELLERSDHVTIRLVCFRAGPLRGDLASAMARFEGLGLYCEGVGQYSLLIDIGPADPLPEIVTVLRRGQADGSWEYEEGRITDAWIAASG